MIFRKLQYGGSCHIPPVAQQAALEVAGLTFHYPGNSDTILNSIDLSVEPGERVALVGPNGAGKSTLLKLVLGLEQHTIGSISVYGNPAHQCLHRVSIVPQRTTVDWRFPVTVRQVVTMGRYVHLGWFKRPNSEDIDRVYEALRAMEIEHLADRQVGELSGGQQQRVMLARTLAHDADLMLMDEPLNHVDISTQEVIFHTLERLSDSGKTAIVSTHDLGILTVHFTRAVFLDHRVIADGPIREVLTPETIARAYGFEFHADYGTTAVFERDAQNG